MTNGNTFMISFYSFLDSQLIILTTILGKVLNYTKYEFIKA